jgi:hypothetical protein
MERQYGRGSRREKDDFINLKRRKSKIASARLAKRGINSAENWSAFKNDTKASTLDPKTNGKIDPQWRRTKQGNDRVRPLL